MYFFMVVVICISLIVFQATLLQRLPWLKASTRMDGSSQDGAPIPSTRAIGETCESDSEFDLDWEADPLINCAWALWTPGALDLIFFLCRGTNWQPRTSSCCFCRRQIWFEILVIHIFVTHYCSSSSGRNGGNSGSCWSKRLARYWAKRYDDKFNFGYFCLELI